MKRILRYVIWAIGILLIGLYVILPFVMAIAVIIPNNNQPGLAPNENFATVTLTTEDDVQLGAWYAMPQNGMVIILVHGAGDGRGSMSQYATLLQENGFGVLALNLRGYGDSEGRINRLGWQGTWDIGAAVSFLMAQDEVQAIGALGTSLGGEVLLGAAETYSQIRAIVADGATFRSGNEYVALDKNHSIIRNYSVYLHTYFVQLLTGTSQPAPLIDSIAAATETQFLFIAAGNVGQEIDFNTAFVDVVGTRGDLWVAESVDHVGAFARYPEEYGQRMIGFFLDALDGLGESVQ